MKRTKSIYLALLVMLSPLAAQAQYDFQSIEYSGQPETRVFGINDNGDAVGNGFTLFVSSNPFVYASMDGTLTDVAPATGYASTSIRGINDAGVMVGFVDSLDRSTQSGFIRSKNGTYTTFSHPDAISQTRARAINNKGLVTGLRDTGLGFPFHRTGFIYDPKTETFTDIVPSFIAQGISSKGEVVGDARNDVTCPNPTAGRYGFVRAKDGSMIFFQINGWPTAARGINDAGMIVGFAFNRNTAQTKGFVIKAPESSCESVAVDSSDLLQFPDSDNTSALGITNSGDIVGVYFDASGARRGFIATPQ